MKFIFVLSLIGSVLSQVVCPAKCPSCTKCDPKKGTCSLPRDFVTCTKNALPGVCFAGTCNAQLTLPLVKASNKCQTYTCPVSGECTLITAPDGFDCTPTGVEYTSSCISGVCQRLYDAFVLEGFPLKNTGCNGKPDGSLCDTNHVVTDGEKCIGGICKYPDGSYYGYV